MRKILYIFCLISLIWMGCSSSPKADVIYYNAKIYTVDSAFSIVEAIAIKDGKIIATGSSSDLLKMDAAEKIDLKGQFVYPGFYDAHCHFYGYGVDLKKTWLIGTTSFDAIIDTLVKYQDRRFMGWVFGRGWDQNDWTDKSYPNKAKLDSLFPDVPVILLRIDGHAALVNQKALDLCNVNETSKVLGGDFVKQDGKLTGLLIDNAVDFVKLKVPTPGTPDLIEALLAAQKNCFEVGLTNVTDAGLDISTILLIDSLQKASQLKMRMNAMVSYTVDNLEYYRKNGKYHSDRLNVQSFKLYADGALGSRGACLLHPYADMPNHTGFLLSTIDSIIYAAQQAKEIGFQLNTHCIGDSANRLLLRIYGEVLKGKNDLRWRIEHAQVLSPDDFGLFSHYSIIPSVQPTHATSDMYWAKDRVGEERIKTAYAYKKLLNERGMIAAGSDFPVEAINPLFGFYAAVVRKDQNNFPENGFQPENALTREEALKAMTIWAAYAGFEESYRGSLEKGKDADFVILEKDLMQADEKELFKIKVLQTHIAGERVF
ncbi:MAG: amidohydrolase [Bacteroidia bacterium]